MDKRMALIAAALVATAEAHAGLFIPTARNANDRDLPDYVDGRAPQPGATQCTCADGLPNVSPWKPPPADVEVEAGGCWSDPGMNYNSHAHNIGTVKAKTASACCATCSELDGCKFFTWLHGTCWLKNATAGRVHLAGASSGGVGAKPPLPAPGGGGGNHNNDGQPCDQGLRVNGGGQPCLWWSQGCSIGCAKCATDLIGPHGSAGGNPPKAGKIGFQKRFCNASYNSHGKLDNLTSILALLCMTVPSAGVCFRGQARRCRL